MIWTPEPSAWRRQRSGLGVLDTLYDRRTNLARDSYSHVQKVFGDKVFKPSIGKNVRLEESPAYKETILGFAPDSSGAREYEELVREVLRRVA
jgi:chromosome partitioning protein